MKSERTSGFEPRAGWWAGFPARLLSVVRFENTEENKKSGNLAPGTFFIQQIAFILSTGRRIGLSLITTWSLVQVQPSVQLCRSSSVVEHVPIRFLSVGYSTINQ